MKRLLALLLAALLMVSVISVSTAAEPVTLDVIICDYGPNTQNWFLGNGIDGSNFVKNF